MSWVIRFALFFVVFWICSRLVRSFLAKLLNPSPFESHSGKRTRGHQTSAPTSGTMIKDPQCGMYVAENLAIHAQIHGTSVYFCSEKCHTSYVSEAKNQNQTNQQPF